MTQREKPSSTQHSGDDVKEALVRARLAEAVDNLAADDAVALPRAHARAIASGPDAAASGPLARIASLLRKPVIGLPTAAAGVVVVAATVTLLLGLWGPNALPTSQFVVEKAVAALEDTTRPGTVTYIEYTQWGVDRLYSETTETLTTQRVWRSWDGRFLRRETSRSADPLFQRISVERDRLRVTYRDASDQKVSVLSVEYDGMPSAMLIHLPFGKCQDCHGTHYEVGHDTLIPADGISPREQMRQLMSEGGFEITGRDSVNGAEVYVLETPIQRSRSGKALSGSTRIMFRTDTYDFVRYEERDRTGRLTMYGTVAPAKVMELDSLPAGFFEDPKLSRPHELNATVPMTLVADYYKGPIYWCGERVAIDTTADGESWYAITTMQLSVPRPGTPWLPDSTGDEPQRGSFVGYSNMPGQETYEPAWSVRTLPLTSTKSLEAMQLPDNRLEKRVIAGRTVLLQVTRPQDGSSPGDHWSYASLVAYIQMPDATVRIDGIGPSDLPSVIAALRLLGTPNASPAGAATPSAGTTERP